MQPPFFKTRFAPSPTGLLHLGNVRTALFNALLARHQGGVFMLRIEDTDLDRSHADHVTALMADLRWLGMGWDEGPEAGGDHGPYAQSQRRAIYDRYFADLEARELAYPCFCTDTELALERKTQLAAGQPPRYSGRCRGLGAGRVRQRLANGEHASLRFRVPDDGTITFPDGVRGEQRFASRDIGDFVIRRSDGMPAFFFSNAVDDALMGVTLVLRGEDHLSNTPRQIMLLRALGLRVPDYAHIAMVVGADGAPLSKRHGSRSVRELRETGFLPGAVINYLARLGHSYSDNHYMDLALLAAGFDMGRLGRAPAHYDGEQLLHWQREAVRAASIDELWAWMGEAVQRVVPFTEREAYLDAVRTNVVFPADAAKWAHILYADDWQPAEAATVVIRGSTAAFFADALAALDRHGTDFKALAEAVRIATGARGKALFQPLRAALTGELDGPEMARLLALIGVERARRRLVAARDWRR